MDKMHEEFEDAWKAYQLEHVDIGSPRDVALAMWQAARVQPAKRDVADQISKWKQVDGDIRESGALITYHVDAFKEGMRAAQPAGVPESQAFIEEYLYDLANGYTQEKFALHLRHYVAAQVASAHPAGDSCGACGDGCDGYVSSTSSTNNPEHEAQDIRCECCGYMTYQREHMNCIRSATPAQVPDVFLQLLDISKKVPHFEKVANCCSSSQLNRAIELCDAMLCAIAQQPKRGE